MEVRTRMIRAGWERFYQYGFKFCLDPLTDQELIRACLRRQFRCGDRFPISRSDHMQQAFLNRDSNADVLRDLRVGYTLLEYCSL